MLGPRDRIALMPGPGSREAVPTGGPGRAAGAEFLLYNVYRNELMFLRRFLEAIEFRGFF